MGLITHNSSFTFTAGNKAYRSVSYKWITTPKQVTNTTVTLKIVFQPRLKKI